MKECESDPRFASQTQVLQAALVQAYFGLFSGSSKLFQHAESTRSFLVAASKRLSLLRSGSSALQELKRTQAEPSENDIIGAQKQDDRMLRLGWCIYVSPQTVPSDTSDSRCPDGLLAGDAQSTCVAGDHGPTGR